MKPATWRLPVMKVRVEKTGKKQRFPVMEGDGCVRIYMRKK